MIKTRAVQSAIGDKWETGKWYAQVWSDYAAAYVDISASPSFNTAIKATEFAQYWSMY